MQKIKLLLFDLDGTLMLSGGAGMRAMERVFYGRFGVKGVFSDISPDGKTDPMIFREILKKRDIPVKDEPKLLLELAEEYRICLKEEMPDSPGARLMPGVPELLEVLRRRKGLRLGLLTGNFEPTARIKLERFNLNPFFPFGAFASDHDLRARLVPIAVARAEAHAGHAIGLGRHVFIIGDTPLDVQAALDNRVTAVGVGSFNHSAAGLKAAGAHICFEDLSDHEAFLAAVEAWE